MKLEVLSLVLRLDCLSCVLTVFFDDSGWEKMLGGLGAGGGEQPDHFASSVKNSANWLHSGEPSPLASRLICSQRHPDVM